MEREANYVAVGAFVLLILAMGSLFVYWYSASSEHRDFERYEIYFDGSVSGLEKGGTVRYLGVDVGRVLRVRIDQRAADRVMVVVDIDATTPVSPRTLAQLSLQGVTGLLYIDLLQEPESGSTLKVLADVPSQQYPVIRSVRGNFDSFVSSLPELTTRVVEISERISDLLSEGNLKSVSTLVGNLERASNSLPSAASDAGLLIKELHGATADAHSAIRDIQQAAQTAGPDFTATMSRLKATADNLAAISAKLDTLVGENRAAVNGFVRDGLPQIEALARDGRAAANEFKALSRSLRQNPSRLIYQPATAGVEIPR
jgi:phospholipid/cholesterol/gamma-HCH transport system substrate-binding protein